MVRHQIGVGRLRQDIREQGGVDPSPTEVPAFEIVADNLFDIQVGGPHRARNGRLQNGSGGLLANDFVVFGRRPAGSFEHEFVLALVELPVEPEKSRRLAQLLEHVFVAGGQSDSRCFVVERRLCDEFLQRQSSDSVIQALFQGNASACLIGQVPQFVLQFPPIVVHRYFLVADRSDGVDRSSEVADAETRKPEDEQTDQNPDK